MKCGRNPKSEGALNAEAQRFCRETQGNTFSHHAATRLAVRAASTFGPRISFGFRPRAPVSPSAASRSAFSLVEVLVAVLILGIAIAGMTEGITTALKSNKDSELQTVAALYAAGRIETLRAEGDYINGETDGDCGSGLPAYQWKQTIKDAGIDGLHEVDVVVEQAQNSREIYELKTFLFEQPTDSSSSAGSSRDKSKSKKSGGTQ